MAGRDAGDLRRRLAGARPRARDHLRRLAVGEGQQEIGPLLVPLESALVAVDPDLEVVLIAGRDLACPEHAPRAARIAQKDIAVVVDPPPRDEGREVGAQPFELQAGDERRKVIGMAADVADRAARPRLRRIRAPGRLLLASLLKTG